MHVLIPVVSRFRQLTGICRHAANHAKALSDLPEVSTVTLVQGDWQPQFQLALANSSPKIKLVTAHCHSDSVSRNFWYARGLPRLANALAATVVHLSYPVPLRRQRFEMPVALTLHDLYPLEYPQNFGFPGVLLNRRFLRESVNQTDAIACVSANTRERLAHYFPEAPHSKIVSTIPSYSELHGESMTRPATLTHDRFILTVGQHRKNKNHALLLEACKTLAARKRLSQLVIVGSSGPETARLKRLAADPLLAGRVTFLRAVSDAELLWLYRHCDAFIAASSIEGFCLPLLEAMQLSPRVICADIPVFREIADRTCLFFSLQGSAVANLAHALSTVTDGRPCNSSLSAARYSRALAAERYSALYSRLLHGTHAAAAIIQVTH